MIGQVGISILERVGLVVASCLLIGYVVRRIYVYGLDHPENFSNASAMRNFRLVAVGAALFGCFVAFMAIWYRLGFL